MSGGSFGYLYNKDAYELFESSNLENLEYMIETLHELAPDSKAELDTQIIYNLITSTANAISSILAGSKLPTVWHSVEWYKSSDTSIESAIEDIRKHGEK